MLLNACCCDPSCLIFKDDFDRANSNDISSNWTDTNSRILDNRLTQQAIGAASAITAISHTSEMMVVDVAIGFTSTSITVDVGGVIVNYLDADNYLFVQIEVISSAFAGTISTKLKFFRRAAGVSSQLGSTRTIDASNGILNHQLRVCYDGTYLKAMGYREAAAKIVDGFKAGVYSSASSAVYFNNFRWWKHTYNCPNCNVPVVCDNKCSPQHLATSTVVIDLGAGGLVDGSCSFCDQILGEYILTPHDPFAINASGFLELECFQQCGYSYQQCGLCTVAGFYSTRLLITACILDSDAGGTSWSIGISFNSTVGFAGFTCAPTPGYGYFARYTGAIATRHHCDTTPITLTRVFHEHNVLAGVPAFCTGGLPAAAELRLV